MVGKSNGGIGFAYEGADGIDVRYSPKTKRASWENELGVKNRPSEANPGLQLLSKWYWRVNKEVPAVSCRELMELMGYREEA